MLRSQAYPVYLAQSTPTAGIHGNLTEPELLQTIEGILGSVECYDAFSRYMAANEGMDLLSVSNSLLLVVALCMSRHSYVASIMFLILSVLLLPLLAVLCEMRAVS